MGSPELVVGWREWVHLPELSINMMKAKVDTGARTSSLHAEDIHFLRRGRKQFVAFTVFPQQRNRTSGVEAELPLLDQRWVRSSNGIRELRPVIMTQVDVGGVVWEMELTLTRRDLMGFRMLLGRQALRGRATIDPSQSFVNRKAKRKKRVKAPRTAAESER